MQLIVLADAQDNVHKNFKKFLRKRLYPTGGGVTVREVKTYILSFNEIDKPFVEADITAFLPRWKSGFRFDKLNKVLKFIGRFLGAKPMASKTEPVISHERCRVFNRLKERHMIKVVPIGYVNDIVVDGRERV